MGRVPVRLLVSIISAANMKGDAANNGYAALIVVKGGTSG